MGWKIPDSELDKLQVLYLLDLECDLEAALIFHNLLWNKMSDDGRRVRKTGTYGNRCTEIGQSSPVGPDLLWEGREIACKAGCIVISTFLSLALSIC